MRRYSLGVMDGSAKGRTEVARRAEAKLECQFGHGDFGVRQCIACCLNPEHAKVLQGETPTEE